MLDKLARLFLAAVITLSPTLGMAQGGNFGTSGATSGTTVSPTPPAAIVCGPAITGSPACDNFSASASTALATYNANWTVAAGAAKIGTDGNSVTWNSASVGVAFRSDVSPGTSQQSTITFTATDITANAQLGPAVLCIGANSGYALQLAGPGTGVPAGIFRIIKITAGAIVTLLDYSNFEGNTNTLGVIPGDQVTLSVANATHTLTAYKNGYPIMSVVDATFTTGQPGIFGVGTTGTTAATNWIGDVFPTTTNTTTSVTNFGVLNTQVPVYAGRISQVGQAIQFTINPATYAFGGQIGGQITATVVGPIGPQGAPIVAPIFTLESSNDGGITWSPMIGRINPQSGNLIGNDSAPAYSVTFGVSGNKSSTFRFGLAGAQSVGAAHNVYLCGC